MSNSFAFGPRLFTNSANCNALAGSGAGCATGFLATLGGAADGSFDGAGCAFGPFGCDSGGIAAEGCAGGEIFLAASFDGGPLSSTSGHPSSMTATSAGPLFA